MKVFTFLCLSGVALATGQLGFSTQNGGTTGGKGGVVKYVNTATGLVEAVKVRSISPMLFLNPSPQCLSPTPLSNPSLNRQTNPPPRAMTPKSSTSPAPSS